jgi:hypothetical protein
MMMMMKVLWALCSAFVLCLGLLRLRNTEGKGKAGWPLYERSVQASKTNVYRSLQYHTCLQYHSSPQIRNRVHWIGSWHHPVGWLARKSIGTQQVNWHGACTRPPTLISSRPVLICSVESTTKHSAYRVIRSTTIHHVHVACHGITHRGLAWLVLYCATTRVPTCTVLSVSSYRNERINLHLSHSSDLSPPVPAPRTRRRHCRRRSRRRQLGSRFWPMGLVSLSSVSVSPL